MASSSIIVLINSALDDVEFLVSYLSNTARDTDIFKKQRFRLRNLKMFVSLVRKFGNDRQMRYYDKKGAGGSLGSLLTRIEVAVSKNSQKIPPNFLGSEAEVYARAESIASRFQRGFQFLKEEIDKRYIAISNNMLQSSSLTGDEVVEITESILENLVDFPCFRKILAEPMEALREHMKFLRNFCRFATNRGVQHQQMQDFLTHTEAVAISAAHLCFLCGADMDNEEWRKEMQFRVSILLQKIKPTDPQVYETYSTLALSCTKLSRRFDAPTHVQEMEDDSVIVMKNFVDSLISILWEMLQLDTCHVVSLKDNSQVLYEGLRSLRAILNKLPNNIDEQTRDDIGVAVCDWGVLVCSFYQKNVDIHPDLQDLLKRNKVFLAKVGENVPQASRFNSPRTNELDFLDFLLENLMELTDGKVEPVVLSRVQSIKVELLYMKSFLEEIVELLNEQEEVRDLWNHVLQVAKQVEFLIDHLIVGDISDSFSMQFDSVMEDFQNIKANASKISYGKRKDIKVKEVTSTSSHVPSQETASTTTEVVGFHEEAISIRNWLQKGPKQLRVVSIVGMGGLGKTTLAAKVYNDLVDYFHVRAWCPVSQTLHKKKLLLELLNQIHAENNSETTEEEDLVQKLWRNLRGKRYLIFLDDIWDVEAWNNLKASFPDDSNGSRMIVTSRNHDVVPDDMLHQESLSLRELNKEESLELLQKKLFPGEGWPPTLYDLGMQIVENCKGLPLTLVIAAGLLAATEQKGWKEIADGLSSGVVSSSEQCMNTLELSYKHLPDHLKPCFVYIGAFPEDQEVSVRRLIQLWIAEGFIPKSKLKSLEDAAEDYLRNLIARSLVMVARQRSTAGAKQRSIDGVKTCRIHDLLHEFCLKKANEEHFFHMAKGYDELLAFNEPCNLRRLCIHSKPEHFKDSKVFCPRARSLLFFSSQKRELDEREASISISFIIHTFKIVRVLDIEQILLGDVFPSEMKLLVQLRYLAIRGRIRVIPSWVANFSMLETFIVDPCGVEVSLPDTIWNLRKLKYVHIRSARGDGGGGGTLPIENLDSSSGFYEELESFCVAVFICRGSMEKQMRKFLNIRKLKCMLSWRWNDTEEFEKIGVPDFLSRLESLHMMWNSRLPHKIQIEFFFPENLKKLTLSGFRLPWSKISTIGELPYLEVLKLLTDSFVGETWELKEGEFPNLRYLKLSALDFVSWTASDDHEFPCLEKLVLEWCWRLKEMPSCLESTQTLEMIQVSNCSPATRSRVKHIGEQLMRMGNLSLKILIRS